MSMPKITIGFGGGLILLGIVGFALTGGSSHTALIPGGFGLVLGGLGFLAHSRENLRKHAMHGAAGVGLFGFLATLPRGVPGIFGLLTGAEVNISAVTANVIMMLICGTFVGLCVRSFIEARRSGNLTA